MPALEGEVSQLCRDTDWTLHVFFDGRADKEDIAMATIAAQAGSQLVLGPDGQMRASVGQILSTPSVLCIIALFFALVLCIVIGIGCYWHALEDAKKLHPNAIGYGKWYFFIIPRIYITLISITSTIGLTVLCIFLVFAMPGPLLAQARITAQRTDAERDVVSALKDEAIAVAKARTSQIQQDSD